MSKANVKVDKDKCRIVTPEFRVSYPHVFKPSVMKGTNNPPKYSITMLFPKDSDLTLIKTAIRDAKIAAFGAKENWPDNIMSPVEDGDKPTRTGAARGEGYEGHWAIKASTNESQRPSVVDENVQPIIDQADFYPGCFARASVFAYVWEFPKNSGRYGVGFILDHVQKLRDGESFGGKKPANEVFSPVNAGPEDSEFASDEQEQDFV
jgi:hypothetical protein